MILQIRLTNFFSIKDEICLDFRAAGIHTALSRGLSSNIIKAGNQSILKCLGLFGPNASGKSNILKAINFCCRMILDSHNYNEGLTFNFMPFKFEGFPQKPSSFFIDFIHEGIEYEYAFSLSRTEDFTESLYHYPNGRRAKVFTRDEAKGKNRTECYHFAEGVIPRPFDIAENTSKKTLFLSRASVMGRELCQKLYRFFMERFLLGFVPMDRRLAEPLFAANKDAILRALSVCDSDISDITAIKGKIKAPALPPGLHLPGFPQEEFEAVLRFETAHFQNPHIRFDLAEESAGTVNLFTLLMLLLDVVKQGKAIMLDEFDQSLHVRLADFIISLFNAAASAQFLFTTHTTNLIDIQKFRRDQILFVNKKPDGSTEVYSLYAYKDFRENMDAEKGYNQGRFDAVPVVDTSSANLKELLGI